MKNGKKYLAYKIIYLSLKHIQKNTKNNPLVFLRQAIRRLNPGVKIKKRKEGDLVITELGFEQGEIIAIKWLLRSALKRSGPNIVFKLSSELIDVTKGSGYAIREKERIIRIAEANRTIAYFA
uniref:30S ribosomal protein S7, chloroplastic n=1 Tax=Gastrodia angusta TaxID=2939659 RepID=A0A976YHC7_9ASPA|nr:ribosomal protein S7 [Gastrodia angusta]UVG40843.1 ribosomal protein S7 [Gastrodia angusta]